MCDLPYELLRARRTPFAREQVGDMLARLVSVRILPNEASDVEKLWLPLWLGRQLKKLLKLLEETFLPSE